MLPDGSKVILGDERHESSEIMFDPTLASFEYPSISKMVETSLKKCSNEVRESLYGNIVLSGGSTLFEGLTERLTQELIKTAPLPDKVKIHAPADRKYSAWLGGSILTSLASF